MTGRPDPRGEMVDVDGRRVHLVRAGPREARPIVLLQAGSFGFSADWAVVQAQLAIRGMGSLAYDRAGLGLSDPGPAPRDSAAVVADWERLLAVAGEAGPFLLVGHSMAGLHLHLFAARNRDRVVGVVLVDAVTPALAVEPGARRAARAYAAYVWLHSRMASAGLLKPLRRWGDWIELRARAKADKCWAFGDGPHNRAAAAEVLQWAACVAQAEAAGPLDPAWPVAVVSAGARRGPQSRGALQAEPARASSNGYRDHIEAANHANMIGARYAERVVAAIDHVRRAAAVSG